MINNYDRIKLLKKILELRGRDADWLTNQMGISIVQVYSDLQGDPPVPSTVAKISKLLDIPEAFLWNGFRIEDGKMLSNDPAFGEYSIGLANKLYSLKVMLKGVEEQEKQGGPDREYLLRLSIKAIEVMKEFTETYPTDKAKIAYSYSMSMLDKAISKLQDKKDSKSARVKALRFVALGLASFVYTDF